jgi:hypothetical protein
MTLDIAKFYRTCPVLPDHKPWLVIQGDKGFYIDHNCPFGCSSSSSNAGMIANAAMDIWYYEGIRPVVKYEDDVNVFRFPFEGGGQQPDGSFTPYSYPYNRIDAMNRISNLNIPWHPDKGQDFSPSFTYIGFFWDIENKQVCLPEEKRIKFLTRTRTFIASFAGHPCQIVDVMKIYGSLCHIAFVYPEGRSHLASLSNFITTFHQNTYTRHYPPPSLITDLRWWEETLLVPNVTRPLLPRGPIVDLHLFVDASTSWGIGIIFGDKWDAWRLSENWKGPHRDIGWLKGVALEILIYIIDEKGLHDCLLLIHSDNQGVIGAFDKGRSRNFEINLSIHRSSTILALKIITLSIQYIESEKNPADPISRGILGPAADHLLSTFKLPKELTPFLSHVQV